MPELEVETQLKKKALEDQKKILAPLNETPNPEPDEDISTPSKDFDNALNRSDKVVGYTFTWSFDSISKFFKNLFRGKE